MHLDVEEMCRCLSKALTKHIQHSEAVKSSRESLEFFSPLPSLPDFFGDNTGHLSLDRGVQVHQGVLSLFEQQFNAPERAGSPSEGDIYNFVKNLIFRAKLEKECSIICLIYIERMISTTGLYLNKKNWKRVTLIALTLSSKVWDDESYENIHFAKTFTQFSLKEINTLERLFLTLIDYQVGIRKSEYAKYYFILRTYIGKSTRNFPLRALDVDTVRRLQSNAHRAESALSKVGSVNSNSFT